MDRQTLLWALVFSVPPGIGLTGFAARVLGRGVLDPVAVAAGAAAALVLFVVVAVAATVGSADERREGGAGS